MKLRALKDLLRDQFGAMAVETALVAPVLAVMALGTFEVGSVVSRQQELQSAASEAEGIILAAAGGPGATSTQIESVIETSLGLEGDQVTLAQRFRCDTASSLVTSRTTCPTDQPIYEYVRVDITDSYTPVWTSFGVGSAINYNISRTVQVQ
jgi:Flp pilus assembly protein TadG